MMASRDYRSTAYLRYESQVSYAYDEFVRTYDRLVTPHINIGQDWRCLDIACGKGNFLAFLRHKKVLDFVGVDITEAAVRCAAAEFGAAHAVQGSATDMLASSQSRYQLISALDFVEHIHKDELARLLELVADKLEPGGYLLIRTPNASAPFGMAARYNDITHETCFTVGALVDFVSRFGLSMVSYWDDVGSPRTLVQVCHWLLWRTLSTMYRALGFIETGCWESAPMTRNFWLLLQLGPR